MVATLALTAASVWARGMVYPDNNHGQEIPGILLQAGQTQWTTDLSATSFQGVGPRWLYQQVMGLFAQDPSAMGPAYHAMGWLALLVSFASILALAWRGQRLGLTERHAWAIGITVAAALYAPLHTWSIPILDPQPRPGTFAVALVCLAYARAAWGHWTSAWLLLAGAVWMQFLVGLYGGVALAVVAALAMRTHPLPQGWKRWAWIGPSIWLLGLAVLAYTNTRDTTEIDVVAVFGAFRVPHHWFATTGSLTMWMADAALVCAAFLAWWRMAPPRRRTTWPLLAIAGMGVLAAAINVVGVDMARNALMGQLQMQRALPFAQAAALVLVCLHLVERGGQGTALTVILLILACGTGLPGWVLLPVILLQGRSAWAIGWAGVAFWMGTNGGFGWSLGVFVEQTINAAGVAGVAVALYLCSTHTRQAPWAIGATALAAAAALYTQPQVDTWVGDTWSLAQAAPLVESHVPSPQSVAVPPLWAGPVTAAPVVLNRSIYVHAGNVPYTPTGLREWHRRLSGLYGQDVTTVPQGLRGLEQAWRVLPESSIQGWLTQEHVCWLLDFDDREGYTWTHIGHAPPWRLWKNPECLETTQRRIPTTNQENTP